ncbi:MAG: HEAT repeat domain-containing protein [candidate division Zixibacteria bacterium]|nr:HEAT repeat domain-containing protein [candidate division Zixibacteria bacterium]
MSFGKFILVEALSALILLVSFAGCGSDGSAHKKLAQIAVWEDQGWTANGALTAFLSDRNEDVRERAVLALGRVNDTLALDSLRRVVLGDPSPRVRAMAAFSLSAWTWQAGKGALLDALANEKDPLVLVPILHSLGRVYARDESARYYPFLRHPDPGVRAQAALTFDMVNRREAADSVLPLLHDPDSSVRWMAMYALIRAKSDSAARRALAFCNDANPDVRNIAYRLAGSVKTPESMSALLAGLNDPDPYVRIGVADGFLTCRDTGLYNRVLPYFDTEPDFGVLQRLVRSLGEYWRDERMGNAFQRLLHHPNPGIRAQAAGELCKRRDVPCGERVTPAAADPDPFVRLAFLESVDNASRFGLADTAILSPVMRLLCSDSVPTVRAHALQSYSGLGPGDLGDYINRAYHDPDPGVVAMSISLIGSIHVMSYVDSLHALYPKYRDDPNPDVKWAITAASANMLPSVFIDSTRQDIINWGMADPNRLVRWYTIAVAFKFRQDRRDGLGVYRTDLNVGNVDSLLPVPGSMLSARLQTTKGTITIRFDTQWAPRTTRQFVAIARSGAYDRSRINDVQAGQLIQMGDRRGDFADLPPANLRDELSPLRLEPGAVFWMIQTRDSGRGLFSIALGRIPYQDWRFAVFAHVTQGLEVARSLSPADSIRTVEILTGPS